MSCSSRNICVKYKGVWCLSQVHLRAFPVVLMFFLFFFFFGAVASTIFAMGCDARLSDGVFPRRARESAIVKYWSICWVVSLSSRMAGAGLELVEIEKFNRHV